MPTLSEPYVCRPSLIEAAGTILARGDWCTVEVCRDVPEQRWEARLMICLDDPLVVADAIEEWVAADGSEDVRLAGYSRDRLGRDDEAPVVLCHVAGLRGA
jgi:hypothetical protein